MANYGTLTSDCFGFRKRQHGEIVVKKVKGASNPSDMMTKNVNSEKMDKYMQMVRQRHVAGRASEGLCVKKR